VLDSGELLNGRYRLEELLGRGGMGEVWRATDLRLARTVAIKACLTEPDARFTTEARVMASLHHPRIVNIYDYGDFYLVMEFVDGQSLSSLLDERGPLDSATTARLTSQVAEALQVVHEKGIVHRDVKPANILLDSDGNAKLTDFGVASSGQGSDAVQGTARYMAPEQAMGQPVTPAADIYALGAVAYHCVSGVPPFGGTDAVEIALRHIQDAPPPLPDTVAPALRQAITRAMAKQPEERFPTASDFATAVSLGSGLDTTRSMRPLAPPPPPAPPPAPIERRRRGVLFTIAAAIVMIALGGLLIAATLNDTNSGEQPVQPPAAPASSPGRSQPGPATDGTGQEQVRRPSQSPAPSRTSEPPVTGPTPTRTTNSPTPQQSPPEPTGAPTTPAPGQGPGQNPGQNPGQGPGQGTDQGTGQNPGQGTDQGTDQDPDQRREPRR
jgi:serine/threonine-protein kinase